MNKNFKLEEKRYSDDQKQDIFFFCSFDEKVKYLLLLNKEDNLTVLNSYFISNDGDADVNSIRINKLLDFDPNNIDEFIDLIEKYSLLV